MAPQDDSSVTDHVVVIVGAGMAGLMAAKELLESDASFHVTIVEACAEVGGRVKAVTDFIDGGHVIDLGAEFVHGQNTLLTGLIEKYQSRWTERLQGEPLMEDIFISSYADGGPSPTPTKDGKYGMFYCNGELLNYDDERLFPLERLLGTLEDFSPLTERTSLQDVVDGLPPHLQKMAVAGYGNTAGSTRLDQISLEMILSFEEYWHETEDEGDQRLHSKVGLTGVVDELYGDLRELYPTNFDVKLNWNVSEVEDLNGGVRVVSTNSSDNSEEGETIQGDSVIVTCPPNYWPSFVKHLPREKEVASTYVGCEKAIKIMLKFQTLVWPAKIQSLICADDLPIPELWFRDFVSGDGENQVASYLGVGYLTSGAAEELLVVSKGDSDEMAMTMLRQMSTVLSIPLADLEAAHAETRVQVWDVGYMYPKVGLKSKHLQDLAKPHGNIYFAGEATHTGACCTVQAAMETGVRAAQQLQQHHSASSS